MQKIRIVGDLHQKYSEFCKIADDDLPIIQVGDFGYDYSILKHFHEDSLRIIFGNHEHHVDRFVWPHFLNSYGEVEFHGLKFFYVGGAFSIDWKLREKYRVEGVWPRTWWQEEELSYNELQKAIDLYIQVKPKIVITHEPIRTVAKITGSDDFLRNWGYDPKTFTTRTGEALERMFDAWQPKIWISGHMHKKWSRIINGTEYISLGELEYIDIDCDGNHD